MELGGDSFPIWELPFQRRVQSGCSLAKPQLVQTSQEEESCRDQGDSKGGGFVIVRLLMNPVDDPLPIPDAVAIGRAHMELMLANRNAGVNGRVDWPRVEPNGVHIVKPVLQSRPLRRR